MTSKRIAINTAAVAAAAMLTSGCGGSSTSTTSSSAPSSTSDTASVPQPTETASSSVNVPADYPTGTWYRVGHNPHLSKLTFFDSATVRLQDDFGFNDESVSFPKSHRMTFGRSLGGDTYCMSAGTYTYRISQGSMLLKPIGKDSCNNRHHFLGTYTWKLVG